jgi:hypothetical protein
MRPAHEGCAELGIAGSPRSTSVCFVDNGNGTRTMYTRIEWHSRKLVDGRKAVRETDTHWAAVSDDLGVPCNGLFQMGLSGAFEG